MESKYPQVSTSFIPQFTESNQNYTTAYTFSRAIYFYQIKINLISHTRDLNFIKLIDYYNIYIWNIWNQTKKSA